MAGSFGKPAFIDTLALLKKFENGPERRETGNSDNGTGHERRNKQGTDYTADANEQKNPPRPRAEVVFCFYDNRVEESDYQEGG